MDPITTKLTEVLGKLGMDQMLKDQVLALAVDAYCDRLAVVTETSRESLRRKLKNWCGSKAFEDIVHCLKRKELISVQPAVESLQNHSNITDEIEPGLKTTEVVNEFLNEYHDQLLTLDRTFAQKVDRERHQSVIATLQEGIGTVLAELKKRPDLTQEIADEDEKDPKEQHIHVSIDTAVQHLNRGRAQEAQAILNEARQSARDLAQPSSYLLSRIAGNIGCCYLLLQNFSSAKREFEKALDVRPSQLTWSNMSNGHVLCNEFDEALKCSRKALSFSTRNGRVVAAHLQALYANKVLNEVEALIESEPLCKLDGECLMVQGQYCLDNKEFSSAQKLFSEAKSRNPYDPQMPLLESLAIIKPVFENQIDEHPMQGFLSNDAQRIELEKAEQLITSAIELMRDQDFDFNRNGALLNRSMVRLVLGRVQDAADDCKKAYDADQSDPEARIKYSMIILNTSKDHKRIVELLEPLPDELRSKLGLVLASSYLELGRVTGARKSAEEFELKYSDIWQMHYALASDFMRIAEKEKRIEDEITRLLEKYPLSGDVYYAVAEQRKNQRRYLEAIALLSKAEKCQQRTMRDQINRLRVQTYADAGLHSMAASVASKYVDTSRNSNDLFEYIAALANSNQLGSAYALAKQARERQGAVIEVISEIEMEYEMRMKKFSEARQLAVDLCEFLPNRADLRNQLAVLNRYLTE